MEEYESRKDAIATVDEDGDSVLHMLCRNKNVAVEMIRYVETLMLKNDQEGHIGAIIAAPLEENIFHMICGNNHVTIETIQCVGELLLKYDKGMETIIAVNDDGEGVFQYICRNKNVTIEMVRYVRDILLEHSKGESGIFAIDGHGKSAFHHICSNRYASAQIIKHVLDTMKVFDEDKKFMFQAKPCEWSPASLEFILSLYQDEFSTQNDVCQMEAEIKSKILDLPKANDNESLTEHVFIKRLVNEKFTKGLALPVLMMDLYVQIALIFSLLVINKGISGQPRSVLLVRIMIPCKVWLVFRKFVMNRTGYLLRFSNAFDLLQIVMISMIISYIGNAGASLTSAEEERTALIFASFVLVCWVQLLRVIGKFFYMIAVFNAAFIQVGNDDYL